jgi:hypothetical protein
MTTVSITRTPEEFAGDLAELAAIDWRRVWEGESAASPDAWVVDKGWRLAHLDGDLNLAVTTGSGSTLDLFRDHDAGGIAEASQVPWQQRASGAAENAGVVTAALRVWPDYLAAAQEVLGRPLSTAEDGVSDGDLPALPYWPAEPAVRRAERDPLRAAVWSRPGIGAVFTLWLSLAMGTTEATWPGAASVRLVVGPVEADG